ncbi:unnamed protein product [Gordionus sp. m RMFG-2023]|uniref:uncharacterized protein LOC135928831 n=1 Tax=Gordionus sp. m RMFG-2023 TaxID=3053472 RepID=UPI0030E173A3
MLLSANDKFILNLSLPQPALDYKIVNSSGNFTCVPWSVVYKNNKSMFIFFITIAPIVFVMGLVGNSLGLKIAFREKSHPNVIVTRALYSANVINFVTMFIYPILDLIGELKFYKFWTKKPWNRYMANFHFPIAKSLVSFSFGIYVILALSQMIGTAFPVKYKMWFRTRNIMYMLMFNFIYVVLWFIPTRWLFEMQNRMNVCGVEPYLIVYYYKFCYPDTKRERLLWTTYEAARVFFTKFLPALAILLVKIWTNRIHKSLLIKRINRNLDVNSSNLLPPSNKFSGFYRNLKESDNSLSPEYRMAKSSEGESQPSSSKNFIIRSPKLYTKLRDNKVENTLIGIIGIEFVVLLFPVSIFLIFRNFYINTMMDYDIDVALAVCTLVEYLYISLTFYLNLIFNPIYRRGLMDKPFELVKYSKKR